MYEPEDRPGPHNQAQRVQRRQVFVIDVAEESLLEAGRGQAKAFRRWPQTSESSLLAVTGEVRPAGDAAALRLTLTPQVGKGEHPGAEDQCCHSQPEQRLCHDVNEDRPNLVGEECPCPRHQLRQVDLEDREEASRHILDLGKPLRALHGHAASSERFEKPGCRP